MIEFIPFKKIPRLTRGVVVTEKIDGTNAAVRIVDIDEVGVEPRQTFVSAIGNMAVYAQSRSRFITPSDDNYGFAAWVRDNAPALVELGPGVHFGEWWGRAIQRNYGLTERRFSLFNTGRWSNAAERPACCDVVPVLYAGLLDEPRINGALVGLMATGSVAAPGFMKPEGIIVFHSASGQLFKKTSLGEDGHKEAA